MTDVVVPYDPDRRRVQMPSVVLGPFGEQAGVRNAPLHTTGELVAVPFRTNMFAAGVSGAGSAPAIGGGAFPENDDGSQSGMFISVLQSSTFANVKTVDFSFMGRVLGLRLMRSATYANKIGCQIDGVAYDVDMSTLANPVSGAALAGTPTIGGEIIADDLEDGLHTAQLVFPCAAAADLVYGLLGFIAEARYYRPRQRGVTVLGTRAALGAGWTALSPHNTSAYATRKVLIYNPTGSPIVVTGRYNSTAGVSWGKSVPAGESVEFDPGGDMPHTFEFSGNGLYATLVLVV